MRRIDVQSSTHWTRILVLTVLHAVTAHAAPPADRYAQITTFAESVEAERTHSQHVRLQLWVIDTIGTGNGSACEFAGDAVLPSSSPTLTERDVAHWDKVAERWHLGSNSLLSGLLDRCFVLAVDGKLLSSGLVLSSRSARLNGLNTLNVYANKQGAYLQLTSGNHGQHSRTIHGVLLSDVFGLREKLD